MKGKYDDRSRCSSCKHYSFTYTLSHIPTLEGMGDAGECKYPIPKLPMWANFDEDTNNRVSSNAIVDMCDCYIPRI